jgi:hypothetical protein
MDGHCEIKNRAKSKKSPAESKKYPPKKQLNGGLPKKIPPTQKYTPRLKINAVD